MLQTQKIAPTSIDRLPTPSLLLDKSTLVKNAKHKADRAKALNVRLRPHFKTCKSEAVAHILSDPGAKVAAVSTLAEADFFFRLGFQDLRFTAPFSPEKVAFIAPYLRAGKTFEVMVDDPEMAVRLATQARVEGVCIPVIIEIDVDGYRSGIAPKSPRFDRLVDFVCTNADLHFRGIYSFAGKTYRLETRLDRAELVEQHRQVLVQTAADLRNAGVVVECVGIGSSPALEDAQSMEGLTECCAGVYAFQDLTQSGIGVCDIDDIAVSVLAEVVQRNADNGRVFVDAGALALSQDRSTGSQTKDQGYGLVCDAVTRKPLGDGDIIVKGVSQEHGLVSKRDGSPVPTDLLTVGQKVRVLPNHVCMTANAYPGYHVLSGDKIVDFWPRRNGWEIPSHDKAQATLDKRSA